MLSPRPATHVASVIDDTMILRSHIAIMRNTMIREANAQLAIANACVGKAAYE
jgi:hypothetical protein